MQSIDRPAIWATPILLNQSIRPASQLYSAHLDRLQIAVPIGRQAAGNAYLDDIVDSEEADEEDDEPSQQQNQPAPKASCCCSETMQARGG